MEVEFRDDLTTDGRTSTVASEFAAVLRNNPGRWGKWPVEQSRLQAYRRTDNIKKGQYPALPLTEFDVCTADGATWVRYNPNKEV